MVGDRFLFRQFMLHYFLSDVLIIKTLFRFLLLTNYSILYTEFCRIPARGYTETLERFNSTCAEYISYTKYIFVEMGHVEQWYDTVYGV